MAGGRILQGFLAGEMPQNENAAVRGWSERNEGLVYVMELVADRIARLGIGFMQELHWAHDSAPNTGCNSCRTGSAETRKQGYGNVVVMRVLLSTGATAESARGERTNG